MEFNPNNKIVQRCLQGMALEEQGKPEAARELFLQAWHEATNEFEKYLAAHYVARHQKTVADRLQWLETALHFALTVNPDAVRGVFPALYANIAQCYAALGDLDNAKKHNDLAVVSQEQQPDAGPFYHGTKADLQIGDLLIAGYNSNYKADLIMNHVYFTALVNGAGLAAELANGDGRERLYIVEPTGRFENDPNVTDKKFPGNPTRSYRTVDPLTIVGEVTDWVRQTPEQLQRWRAKLANIKGEIIN